MARQNAKNTRNNSTRVNSPRRKSRGVVRKKEPSGFASFLQNVSRKAHQKSNQRNWSSRRMKSVNASIANASDESYTLPTEQVILRRFIAIFLIFPCVISTLAIFQTHHSDSTSDHIWRQLFESREFLFFAMGSILMLAWFFIGILRESLLLLYVFGHEVTHVFFIYLCGGRVSEMKFTQNGGHVVTNKTNILIALSPYFVPFWTCIVLLLSWIIGAFYEIPFHDEAFYLLIGSTWTFHLVWTVWMIPRDQPDLKENDSFFSLTIIYLTNILLLAALLCLSPSGITFKSYCYQWINLCIENGIALIGWLKRVFASF